ncbi:MAG: NRDE family protein [Phycisphaerales bacterium]
MCTVTVIRTDDGCRVMHARDEQRSRQDGLPAVWRGLGSGRRAIWPTDADAGGTWVAARDDGVVLALLNRNIPANGRPPGTRSRGAIIPALIDLESPQTMLKHLAGMDLEGVSPFRLIAIDALGSGTVVTFDGLELSEPSPSGPPSCLASSGLGDEHVQVRLPLFEQMMGQSATPEQQAAYHKHRWDDRPEVSVLMSRRDARTVSITTIDVVAGQDPTFAVESLPEGEDWCDPVGAEMAGSVRR